MKEAFAAGQDTDKEPRVKLSGERINYCDDWSQEVFHNDTHLVPVALCKSLVLS